MMYHGREPGKIWWVSDLFEQVLFCLVFFGKIVFFNKAERFKARFVSVWCSHLRYDTLAQILTLANIHAGSKVLVFETCSGLVLGSVMERMGGMTGILWTFHCCSSVWPTAVVFFCDVSSFFFCNCPLFPPRPGYGSVIQMYPGEEPFRAGVESFGFPAHFHDTLHEFPICRVNALLAGTLDTTAKPLGAGTARLFF